jgi:hypothetical protein
MKQEELHAILDAHAAWLRGEHGGERADLSGQDLYGANLTGADLSGANLTGADLSGANLRGANLRGANLRGATLSGATLRGANLTGADLRGANLRVANLYGANLSGANLAGATVIVAGQDARGYLFYAYLVDGDVEVRAGCHRMPLRDAIAHWSQAHADDPVLQADCLSLVRRIEAMARARGWIAEAQP